MEYDNNGANRSRARRKTCMPNKPKTEKKEAQYFFRAWVGGGGHVPPFAITRGSDRHCEIGESKEAGQCSSEVGRLKRIQR